MGTEGGWVWKSWKFDERRRGYSADYRSLGAARKMEEDQSSMEHEEKEKDPNMNSPSTIHLKCLGASPDDMSKMKDSMMVGIS